MADEGTANKDARVGQWTTAKGIGMGGRDLLAVCSTTQDSRILELSRSANAVPVQEPQACYVSSALIAVQRGPSRLCAWPLSVSDGKVLWSWKRGRRWRVEWHAHEECAGADAAESSTV